MEIFISYRRSDLALAQVGRIGERLAQRYGERRVFRDLEKITAGSDFAEVLAENLSDCKVLVAVIGEGWDQWRETDFVLQEIETALRRKIVVIPVLIGKATMPSNLPESIGALGTRHAVAVSDGPDFALHMGRLTDAIDPHVAPLRGRSAGARRFTLAGFVVVTLGAVALAGKLGSTPVQGAPVAVEDTRAGWTEPPRPAAPRPTTPERIRAVSALVEPAPRPEPAQPVLAQPLAVSAMVEPAPARPVAKPKCSALVSRRGLLAEARNYSHWTASGDEVTLQLSISSQGIKVSNANQLNSTTVKMFERAAAKPRQPCAASTMELEFTQ